MPQTCARAVKARPTSDSLKLRVLRPLSRADRHCKPTHLSLTLGLLNIRSLANKVDDVIALRRDQAIDVLFLVETWHDSDSVSVRLLRSAGLTVLDRPRTRKRHDTLTTNHGGVAVISAPGVHFKRLHSPNCTTFEYLSVRLSSRSTSCTALLIYRTGPVSSLFFTELSNTLDLLVTLNEPIFIIGDLNIHVENHNDHHAKTLLSLLDAYGLTCRVSGPTHDLGGTLDIVASRSDLPPPPVDVLDPGLSDHRLVRWSASLPRPVPAYNSVTTRPWRNLDHEAFRSALASSDLCRPLTSSASDVDQQACLFDQVTTVILDEQVPQKTVRCRRRPSDPWFDEECKTAKRELRRLERRVKRSSIRNPSAAVTLSVDLKALWRSYKQTTNQKPSMMVAALLQK